jgi:hypothetical protein
MSGVRAAKQISSEPNLVPQLGDAEIGAMQDALYDILANGMDSEHADVPTQEVERFLFEHARTPKSAVEFRTFFAMHKLSAGARVPPPALSLPPIQRPQERDMPVRLPVELSVLEERAEPSPFEAFEVTETRKRAPSRVALWAGVLLGTAALGGAGFYGYTMITSLQRDLQRTAEHARENARENQAALETLRAHTVGLESSVAATSQQVDRVAEKSELVLQTLIESQKPKWQRKYNK